MIPSELPSTLSSTPIAGPLTPTALTNPSFLTSEPAATTSTHEFSFDAAERTFISPTEFRLDFEEDVDLNRKTPSKLNQRSSSGEKARFQTLLGKQITIQESLYNEVKESLGRIENELKESARYNRKRYYLEMERLKLDKQKVEREEKLRVEENKLKMMDLEIKKRKLDIEEKKMHLLESSKENERPNY